MAICYGCPNKLIQISLILIEIWPSLVAQMVKSLPTMRETQVRSLGQEDPLEKEMATHSSTLAWKIPWTEEPGRLQSMGSQRVRKDLVTSLKRFLSPNFKVNKQMWFVRLNLQRTTSVQYQYSILKNCNISYLESCCCC